MNKKIRTAEYVTPSHPDKVCDQISDAVLDACLKEDKNSRVAVETMGGHGKIKITGEITTGANPDYLKIAKEVYKDCGYEDEPDVEVNISEQSQEISQGVDTGGAGDQGIMVGYACDENKLKLPQEYALARDLAFFLYEKYKVDGKTQITMKGKSADLLVASFSTLTKKKLEDLILEWIESDQELLEDIDFSDCEIICNPAGDWEMSGFEADAGLTGRKIVVDSYGPRVPVGGGAFSGKDATKVDRSGAYMARKVALSYLDKFNASEVTVKLGYAIGKSEPVMKVAYVDGKIVEIDDFDLTPGNIIKSLKLTEPKYRDLARKGHFGRSNLEWEKV